MPRFRLREHRSPQLTPDRFGYAKPHICCFLSRISRKRGMHLADRAPSWALPNSSCWFPSLPPSTVSSTHLGPRTSKHCDFFARPNIQELHDEMERILGLHVAFAIEVLSRQHRNFFFSISLHGTSARFFRWDRAGCVVSYAFDIHAMPFYLSEFLWQFAKTSYVERGHDPTVKPATSEHASHSKMQPAPAPSSSKAQKSIPCVLRASARGRKQPGTRR
ncbi:hypothetical protein BD413DRAFT_277180 [Trametes elegans]|nr:hypothetical protein BD413DRAFT_277180 [Trametes elegans]